MQFCKRKWIVSGTLICLLLLDFTIGLIQYNQKKAVRDNCLVFDTLCNLYFSVYQSFEQCALKDRKYFLKYIPNWKCFFTGNDSSFPYMWHDKEYLIAAPASVNYLRKVLYRRKAAYLLFDMNNAPESIQHDPKTIIIAEPFPTGGCRRVFTVNNLDNGGTSLMSEIDFQKQIKFQGWTPKILTPPANVYVPDLEGDFLYEKTKLNLLNLKKMPLSNIKDNPYKK